MYGQVVQRGWIEFSKKNSNFKNQKLIIDKRFTNGIIAKYSKIFSIRLTTKNSMDDILCVI